MQSQRTSQNAFSLTYRGISYQQNPVSVATEPSQTTARYRGVAYTLQCPVYLPIANRHNLKYRGVPYGRSEENPMGLRDRAVPCPTY